MEIKIRLKTDSRNSYPTHQWLKITGNQDLIEFEIVGYDEDGRKFGVSTTELLAAIGAVRNAGECDG